MGRNYADLHDPNAEYTMRELSTEMMGVAARRGDDYNAEITDVQTMMVDDNFPWTLTRIYAGADVVGTGGAHWGVGVSELIERTEPLVIGENPLGIDHLYEHPIQKMFSEGSVEDVTVTAISGIEVMLHDLTDRILDIPAYRFLGGKYRDKMRVYYNHHTEEKANPKVYTDRAEHVADELGYDALKFDLDVPSDHEKDRANRHLCPGRIRYKAGIAEKVTEHVRDKAGVAFSCHWMFLGGSAKRLTAGLEDYDVRWLEDLVPPGNLDVQEEATKPTLTPITIGENRYRATKFHHFIEDRAAGIVALGMSKVDGIRKTQEIVDVVNQYYVPAATRDVSSPVATMASAHAGTAVPNSLTVEYHSYELDWQENLVGEAIIENGYTEIPEKLSLSVALDINTVKEHTVDGETLLDETQAEAKSVGLRSTPLDEE